MADGGALCCSETQHGQPGQRLTLAQGDTAWVALQGAHVVSWRAAQRERLYLSPRNRWDGHTAVRGGVPVCFPQFNQRGSLPKHGFARNLAWTVGASVVQDDKVEQEFFLVSSPSTQAFWPQQFEATVRVLLTPGALTVTLWVRNTDSKPLEFSGALHTYLAVDQIEQARLTGLQGQAEWDAVRDHHATAAAQLQFDGEFDRVYKAAPSPSCLHDGANRLAISQSGTWADSVVWNPGREKCAAMADLPGDGYLHFVCVEAAQVMSPITLPAAGTWQGWQRLCVLED
ncbi:MAG: D-hexose-6-phosphate mutarotase [Rhodoferax sp.]